MIIVTGGAGFIGSNIIKALNKQDITDILVVDNFKNSSKFANLVDLSITDYIDKENFLLQIKLDSKKFNKIEGVLHEGACTSVTECDGKYMMDNNYQYSKVLLHYCLEHRIPFLYASSAAIYGCCTSDFIESREHEQPLNIYGYSKFLFDEYVRKFLPRAHSQIVGLRYFNVYGPREGHKGNMASVVFQLHTQLNNNENPKLFKGSENFKRDFIYVDDVANVNLWFLKKGKSGIFNLGTGCATSFHALAHTTMTYHKKNKIEYIAFPNKLKNRYQIFTQANLSNLRAAGYNKPFKTITEGIAEYMSWLNHDMKA